MDMAGTCHEYGREKDFTHKKVIKYEWHDTLLVLKYLGIIVARLFRVVCSKESQFKECYMGNEINVSWVVSFRRVLRRLEEFEYESCWVCFLTFFFAGKAEYPYLKAVWTNPLSPFTRLWRFLQKTILLVPLLGGSYSSLSGGFWLASYSRQISII